MLARVAVGSPIDRVNGGEGSARLTYIIPCHIHEALFELVNGIFDSHASMPDICMGVDEPRNDQCGCRHNQHHGEEQALEQNHLGCKTEVKPFLTEGERLRESNWTRSLPT